MTAVENNSGAEFHLTFWKIRLIYRCLPPTPPSINPHSYQTLSLLVLLVCLTEGETISQRPCRSIVSIEQPQSGLFITSTLFFSSFSSRLPFILHLSAPLGLVVQVFDPCETRIKATYILSLSFSLSMWVEWLWGCVSGVRGKLEDMLAQVSDVCPLCVLKATKPVRDAVTCHEFCEQGRCPLSGLKPSISLKHAHTNTHTGARAHTQVLLMAVVGVGELCRDSSSITLLISELF